jgi:hypothetical protein
MRSCALEEAADADASDVCGVIPPPPLLQLWQVLYVQCTSKPYTLCPGETVVVGGQPGGPRSANRVRSERVIPAAGIESSGVSAPPFRHPDLVARHPASLATL